MGGLTNYVKAHNGGVKMIDSNFIYAWIQTPVDSFCAIWNPSLDVGPWTIVRDHFEKIVKG